MNCAQQIADADTRVLLVEDEPSTLDASERYLDHCGFSVATAANEDEALEEAADQTPDVVVCDWQLGNRRDGVDIARRLQARYGCAIVFVTAFPLAELRAATNDLEVACYLRKPFALSVLAAAIRRS